MAHFIAFIVMEMRNLNLINKLTFLFWNSMRIFYDFSEAVNESETMRKLHFNTHGKFSLDMSVKMEKSIMWKLT